MFFLPLWAADDRRDPLRYPFQFLLSLWNVYYKRTPASEIEIECTIFDTWRRNVFPDAPVLRSWNESDNTDF